MEDKGAIINEIAILKEQRDNLNAEIEAFKSEIGKISEGKMTFGEQMTTRLANMEKTIEAISENVDKINKLHDEILVPKEGDSESQLELVREAFSKVSEYKMKSEKDLEAIEVFKVELFGDPEKNVEGQKQRIDTLEAEIKTSQKKWYDNADALFNKIEGLLPGATATGLSKAYQDQRKSYVFPYWLWSAVFVCTLCGTIFFAIKNLHDVTSLGDAFMKVISRLPFFVPAFWLAIFASKQQSQNKRLEQEYAYKEALTKSYEADKRELEKLPDSPEKEKLSIELLGTMIEAAKYNPSDTLSSKTHNDGPPSVVELFKLSILSKLNGMNKPN
jgi:hypothetical protein